MRTVALPAILLAGTLAIGLLAPAHGQEIRLANGVIVKGDVKEVTDAGLTLETLKGPKTCTWETLAPSTRFRYEPRYRANYSVVLAGLPPSRRTNAPDLPGSGPRPAASQAEPEPARPAQPAAPVSSSLKLVDQVVYENIEPLATTAIPGLELRAPDTAAYWGLQYGPRRADILYVAFDAKDSENLRDTLFLYGPGHAEFGETTRQKALKKREGELYIANFKKIEVAGTFGAITANYGIRFDCVAGRARDIGVTIDVELAAQDAKSTFTLYGQPTDLVFKEGIVNTRGILDLPVLWVGLDPANKNPQLIGDLKMSRMKLCPRRGMENAVAISVVEDQSGSEVQKGAVKLDESVFRREYGIVQELARVQPGGKYIVRASIDLGPFMGEVTCEERIAVPAAP